MASLLSRRIRRRLAVGCAAAVSVGAAALVPSSAHAYGNLQFRYVTITSTSTCKATSGSQWVSKVSGGCRASDKVDGTFFAHDAGGRPGKVEMLTGSTHRGKVEFHPYGERLWVYDTSNDGDALYYELVDRYTGAFLGIYSAPSTSKKIDARVYHLNLAEGRDVRIKVFDSIYRGRGTKLLTMVDGRA